MRPPSLPAQGMMFINHASAGSVNTVLFHSLYKWNCFGFRPCTKPLGAEIRMVYHLHVKGQKLNSRGIVQGRWGRDGKGAVLYSHEFLSTVSSSCFILEKSPISDISVSILRWPPPKWGYGMWESHIQWWQKKDGIHMTSNIVALLT